MSARTVVIFTTGPAGSGKSYVRCPVFLLKEFLPEREGVHWSNFPVGEVPPDHRDAPRYTGETFVDRMAEELEETRKMDPEWIRERVRVIPEEELQRWQEVPDRATLRENGGKLPADWPGPWSFFEEEDLAGAHIAIDEIHNFCGRKTHAAIRTAWQTWLGEIRHRGATVEFLSQSPMKVAKEIGYEAGARIELHPASEVRDPFLGVTLDCWAELAACWTRKYLERVYVDHFVESTAGRWKRHHRDAITIDPHYFQFYDSFSGPIGGGKSGKTEKREWEKRSRLGVLVWFLGRRPGRVVLGLLAVAALVFLMSGGGGFVVGRIATGFAGVGGAQAKQAAVERSEVERVSVEGIKRSVSEDVGGQRMEAVRRPVVEEGEEPVVVSEVRHRQVVSERDALLDRVQVLEEQVQTMERQRRRESAVVLMTQGTVTMRGGYEYAVGDVIDYGMFEGRTVKELNYERRYVELDDGAVLRLGRVDSAGGMSEGSGGEAGTPGIP